MASAVVEATDRKRYLKKGVQDETLESHYKHQLRAEHQAPYPEKTGVSIIADRKVYGTRNQDQRELHHNGGAGSTFPRQPG